MAGYDSADLLAMFNDRTGRPTSDSVTNAQKYDRLSKAQNRVVAKMMAVCPNSLYPKVGYTSIPTLTTTDGQVYTFGLDANGLANFPSGHGGIYSSLNDIPDFPWVEGRDYMNEGTQIRIPNNGTYGGILYFYGVFQPADIAAAAQPALMPESSRDLIVLEAVRSFAQEYLRDKKLADEFKQEFYDRWAQWTLVWKTQYRSGGAIASYTGLQLALGAQY